MNKNHLIKDIYVILNKYFGDLQWWPAESIFEVMVGAVLTQNTSWLNVEKAIQSIKKHCIMSPDKILIEKNLPEIIKASGCYYIKSKRLKDLCIYLSDSHSTFYADLRNKTTKTLRSELLSIKGIGQETADCIMLYALEKSVFVVDNYTRRILSRHGIIAFSDSYSAIQEKLGNDFSSNVVKLKQYHAVLVETGKRFCKKKEPLCDICPLKDLLSN